MLVLFYSCFVLCLGIEICFRRTHKYVFGKVERIGSPKSCSVKMSVVVLYASVICCGKQKNAV
jgi:hypothetical protein